MVNGEAMLEMSTLMVLLMAGVLSWDCVRVVVQMIECEGDFSEGELAGLGKLMFANKDVYTGGFKCNKMHGKGLYQYANSDVYEGVWIDNKSEGRGLLRYAKGDL
jgi:hypothetical protein